MTEIADRNSPAQQRHGADTHGTETPAGQASEADDRASAVGVLPQVQRNDSIPLLRVGLGKRAHAPSRGTAGIAEKDRDGPELPGRLVEGSLQLGPIDEVDA